MKTIASRVIIPAALTMAVLTPSIAVGDNTIQLSQNLTMYTTNTSTIDGQSGGGVDSKGCGFISNSPNHVLNIDRRVDYMKITVTATGGQPTLLIKGPGDKDSFCILADGNSGLEPEISGVWEPGQYQIYVGDRHGGQYPFKLRISKK